MRKNTSLLLLFLFITLGISAQNTYYKTDSLHVVGGKIKDAGEIANAQACHLFKNADFGTSPYDINEYGLMYGQVYVAADITVNGQNKRVFLERLNTGNIHIYYYRDELGKYMYQLTDSNTYVLIPKETYREQLLELTESCPTVTKVIAAMDYHKKSWEIFFKAFDACRPTYIPRFRYGFLVGREQATLYPGVNIADFDLLSVYGQTQSSLTIGVFIDNPILRSNFSVITSLKLSKFLFSGEYHEDESDYEFQSNITTLGIPVMFRYSQPLYPFRPYVEAGIIMNFQMKNKSLYELNYENFPPIEYSNYYPLIANTMIGVGAGAGIEYVLNPRNSLFAGINYENMLGLKNTNIINMSKFNLTAGIIF